jgi:Domain of unknown function (DUF1905)
MVCSRRLTGKPGANTPTVSSAQTRNASSELFRRCGDGGFTVPAPSYAEGVEFEFSGQVWFWRGPSPYHFVTVPEDESAALQATSALVTYGWGMIPVHARIGSTRWTTSLFPKDGCYVVPLKDAVRRAEGIDVDHTVTLGLTVDV